MQEVICFGGGKINLVIELWNKYITILFEVAWFEPCQTNSLRIFKSECLLFCGDWSWVTRARVLSHLDLFGPNKRGRVCLGSGDWEPRTEGAFSQLTPELLPAWDQLFSLYLSFCPYSLLSRSLCRCPVYSHHFSPRPWPGLLLPLPLWTFWCWLY